MNQNIDKVALFDFCETIANFQTADNYVRFVQSNSKPTNASLCTLYRILNKFRILGILRRICPKRSIDKRFILKQMKGRTYDEMDRLAKEYYEIRIKPNLIYPIVRKLIELQNEGYEIIIVSGGYDIYLKYFAKEYNVKHVLSTSIEFKKGICTGRFKGKDCMFDYKIDYIKAVVKGDLNKWYAFSDSITDLPMLELVGNPIVVSRCKSQEWADVRKMKQIVWN